MNRFYPLCVLFLLAPAIGELLSGSAPPAEFFNPLGFIMLSILYGGGAIIVRELKVRWQKGWLSLLVLGAAYGIVEEGLMVKSFFDPEWMDLGILGTYGRWLGVNWVWSVELMIYHAVISIAIPIMLTELIFPNQRNDSWIGGWAWGILLALFVGIVAFGYFMLTPYRPDILTYFLAIVVVAELVILASQLPSELFKHRVVAPRNPMWFWLIGFTGILVFFIVFWGLPHTPLPPLVTILLGISLVVVIAWLVLRISGNGVALTERHRLALAAGPLSFFILLTPIQEFDTSRTDNTTGMAIVGLAALIFLLWMWWWVRRRSVPEISG
jgi:hypothetical protein